MCALYLLSNAENYIPVEWYLVSAHACCVFVAFDASKKFISSPLSVENWYGITMSAYACMHWTYSLFWLCRLHSIEWNVVRIPTQTANNNNINDLFKSSFRIETNGFVCHCRAHLTQYDATFGYEPFDFDGSIWAVERLVNTFYLSQRALDFSCVCVVHVCMQGT